MLLVVDLAGSTVTVRFVSPSRPSMVPWLTCEGMGSDVLADVSFMGTVVS